MSSVRHFTYHRRTTDRRQRLATHTQQRKEITRVETKEGRSHKDCGSDGSESRPPHEQIMAPFNFQNLQLHQQQIRLFHLQPGEFHDPISATLSIAYLGDCPKYEALSYVWGDPNVCYDITVDDHTVAVTINLWAALRRRESQVVLDSNAVR